MSTPKSGCLQNFNRKLESEIKPCSKPPCSFAQDPRALTAHESFLAALKKLDDDITARNASGSKIRSASGTRGLPYELLRPHSGEGVTSRGVPCSTSI